MDKVLLAIDGSGPDRKILQYALELCTRMKAELKVLQFISTGNVSGGAGKGRTKTGYARQIFEDSMMAATFAEAGEFDTADALMSEALENLQQLLAEFKKTRVPYKLAVKDGNPEHEIVSYVRKNKRVVVMVYGATAARNAKNNEAERLKLLQSLTRALPVPVVMVPAEA
jgi:nucleotide-binding universal stress UspA family protein